jgi:hypothetical protein
MAKNRFSISLTGRQRRALRRIVNDDDASALKVRNARILLRTDSERGDDGQADRAAAKEFNMSVANVERIQQRFLQQGLEAAVSKRPQAKDISDAPDDGALINFGTGEVVVEPDGSTFVSYPGGSVNVDLGSGVSNNVNVNFPGGNVWYDFFKGFAVTYPGGGVFYEPDRGWVVQYPGGEVTYPLNGGITFPGGGVSVGGGSALVEFPTGFVNVGGNGVEISTPGFSGSF